MCDLGNGLQFHGGDLVLSNVQHAFIYEARSHVFKPASYPYM